MTLALGGAFKVRRMNRWGIVAAVTLAATALPITANASSRYTFPVQGCSVTFSRYHHNYPATDILTKVGCSFVAPTDGVIDEVNRVDRFTWKTDLGADRGGLSVSMIGDDGVRYYGSHLSYIPATTIPGLRVAAGDLIAKTGDSGDAKGTAPHLHFGISWPTPKGIWWVRRGELNPFAYVSAWKSGKDISPAKSVAALELKKGTVPKQVGY
jgi:murein DD-endopeptidase MepM/ murein hydrolase activator NlpD